MKTKLVGILAIIIAVAASAFTTPKKVASRPDNLYWFMISGSVAVNAAVPADQATFIEQSATPPSETCASGSTHQCVSGFTSAQVDGDELIDDSETPASQPQKKN